MWKTRGQSSMGSNVSPIHPTSFLDTYLLYLLSMDDITWTSDIKHGNDHVIVYL